MISPTSRCISKMGLDPTLPAALLIKKKSCGSKPSVGQGQLASLITCQSYNPSSISTVAL